MWMLPLPESLRLVPAFVALVLSLSVASCERKSASPSPSGDDLFLHPSKSDRPSCTGAGTRQLATTVSVRLWLGRRVDVQRIARHVHALESLLVPYGIRLELAGQPGLVTADPLFAAGDLQASAAPLRSLLRNLEPATPRELQLVFVDRIVSIHSPVAQGLRHPSGLTLSPFVKERDELAGIEELLGIELAALAAPIVLMSTHELERVEPERRFSTIGHEFGHAFGLEHSGGRDNLMSLVRHTHCAPGFHDEQLEIIAESLRPDGGS